MTDRFQCPEPSPKAHAAAATIINDTVDQLGGFDAGGDALRAAYAIDLPAIVWAEVERMLVEVYAPRLSPDLYGAGEEYLAARFGCQKPTQGLGNRLKEAIATMSEPLKSTADRLEQAWGIIANVTPWEGQSWDWQDAAKRFRDFYLGWVSADTPPAPSGPGWRGTPQGVELVLTPAERAFLRDLANRNADLASAQSLLADTKE